MPEPKKLLNGIFERTLSLERKQASSPPRAMGLFEHMAARLDEIAANTRGGLGTLASQYPQAHAARAAAPAAPGGPARPARSGSASLLQDMPQSRNMPRARSAVMAQEQAAGGNGVNRGKTAPVRSRLAQERKPEGTGAGTSGAPQKGDVARETATDKKAIAKQAIGTEARSAGAMAEVRQARLAEAQGERLEGAITSGWDRLRGMLPTAKMGEAAADTRDALGYALGGPIYGAMKELKAVLPRFEKGEKADRKRSPTANALERGSSGGRERDEKGRFKPGLNEERLRKAQNEVLQDQVDLAAGEAKKDAKRHKELVRAVKANHRGFLERFLDRRAARGGRATVRNKTVIAREKARPDRMERSGAFSGRGRTEAPHGRGVLARAGGAALSGLGAMGGLIARAAPLLTAAMALYDGVSGWNDRELHQKAFNLGNGQEASTGQKASAAAASILDMGGLTSGILGMFGIEFDKAGVARSIYELGAGIASMARSFLDNPIVRGIWDGLGNLASRAWEGARDIGGVIASCATGLWEHGGKLITSLTDGVTEIGGSISEFARNVWQKGGELATSVADWARGAIGEGAGRLTDIWNSAGDAVKGIWADLSGFASQALAKATSLLSDLWKNIGDLPGKLVEGAANMAKSAMNLPGKLWDGVAGFFSSGTARAEEAKAAVAKEIAAPERVRPEAPTGTATEALAPVEPLSSTREGRTGKAGETDKTALGLAARVATLASPIATEAVSDISASRWQEQKTQADRRHGELLEELANINQSIYSQTKLLTERLQPVQLDDINVNVQGAGGTSLGSSPGGGSSISSGGVMASEAYSGLGDVVNMGETGGKGTGMVSSGAGDHGGVSYGRSQLASRMGSIQAAMKWARANGYEDIASQLEPLQGDATNRHGQFARKWGQLAAEKGGRLEQFDRAYQKAGYYDPMMARIRKANPELARRIEANPALQEQVLSTSVQYGMNSSRYLTAASEALGKNAGLSDRELLVAIQDIKARDAGRNFAKSSWAVQRSVARRHGQEEKARLLAVMDRYDRGEIAINPQTGIAQVNQAPQGALPDATLPVRANFAQAANGANAGVDSAMSGLVAQATQNAMSMRVGYKMGSKRSTTGAIDCSGWVTEINRNLMDSVNAAAGREVFGSQAREILRRGAAGGAAGIIQTVGNATGKIYNNAELAPDKVREGMAIGMSLGRHARGRFRDIGHIVQTYRDPVTGEMMVSESSRGARGVTRTRYDDWYKRYQKRGVALHGVNMAALATGDMPSAQAPTAMATMTSVGPAPEPYPGAANSPVTLAANRRPAPRIESIRKIDPDRAMANKGSDDSAILKALTLILQAIQSGNDRVSKAIGNLTSQQNNNGAMNIPLDYADAASRAMGLA